jgi:DNA-binding transcriptional MerR regulator
MSDKKPTIEGNASIDKAFHIGMVRRPSRMDDIGNMRQSHVEELKIGEILASTKNLDVNLNKIVRAINTQNSAITELQKRRDDALAELKETLEDVISTLKTLDAHEIRKVAERLLNKSEAENRLEDRLRKDRLRKNRWAEKNRTDE